MSYTLCNCTLIPPHKIHIFRKIYYCIWNHKQAFWLPPAHSYSKQYIQSQYSQSVLQIHTQGFLSWKSRRTAIYIHFYILCHLSGQKLAWHQGCSVNEGETIHTWCAVLGRFFSRAVNSSIGELLIKRGVHIGLEEWEGFRDTQLQHYPAHLSLFQFQNLGNSSVSWTPLLCLLPSFLKCIPWFLQVRFHRLPFPGLQASHCFCQKCPILSGPFLGLLLVPMPPSMCSHPQLWFNYY